MGRETRVSTIYRFALVVGLTAGSAVHGIRKQLTLVDDCLLADAIVVSRRVRVLEDSFEIEVKDVLFGRVEERVITAGMSPMERVGPVVRQKFSDITSEQIVFLRREGDGFGLLGSFGGIWPVSRELQGLHEEVRRL